VRGFDNPASVPFSYPAGIMNRSKKHFDIEGLKKTYKYHRYLAGEEQGWLFSKFLDDNSRTFEISGHCQGWRVTAVDSEFGSITSHTGQNLPDLMSECMLSWNKCIAKKQSEKIELFTRLKKEKEKDLKRVSEELKDMLNVMLQTFEQDEQ
jgi:hypothetical protein